MAGRVTGAEVMASCREVGCGITDMILLERSNTGAYAVTRYDRLCREAVYRPLNTAFLYQPSVRRLLGDCLRTQHSQCEVLDVRCKPKQVSVFSLPHGEQLFLLITVTDPPCRKSSPCGIPEGLTPREQEIAKLAAQGVTNRYIAYELGIAVGTVKKTLSNCFRKLGISSRFELVHMMIEEK